MSIQSLKVWMLSSKSFNSYEFNPAQKALLTRIWQVASNVFGLAYAVLHCSESTTLEDFSNGILVAGKSSAGERRIRLGSEVEQVL